MKKTCRNKWKTVGLLILALSLTACAKQPSAQIAAAETVPTEQVQVTETTQITEAASHVHVPDMDNALPKFVKCSGGYLTDVYSCIYCEEPCTADGSEPTAADYLPGTGRHEIMLGSHREPRLDSCCGWMVNLYQCKDCGMWVKQDGTEPNEQTDYKNGVHTTLENQYFIASYTPCGGGLPKDCYFCQICGELCMPDGSPAGDEYNWIEGTGHHEPGDYIEADFLPCKGGYKHGSYECKICGKRCYSDGTEYQEYSPDTQPHTPGALPTRFADYTVCGGGSPIDLYECTVCGYVCKEDGSPCYSGDDYKAPTAAHTVENNRCTVCGAFVAN